ncbi:2-3-diketo-5-methylthio-1-phosphopentane phosphatase [Apiospora hydei]|uniref:Enolase-phosphatase E1 n=1 Tax=Apiospora hydei TaxID=1337664 RepID=A0ABR1X1M3_9PEZI
MAASTAVQVVLLDIEGTVCPISFVKDVLFPHALKALPETVKEQWDKPEFKVYRDEFPAEFSGSQDAFQAHVVDLVARDVKVSYLKTLQGYLWEEGYRSGQIKAPLFSDVAPMLARWHGQGIKLMIYSSGSVAAQKLLFKYTNAEPSDLTMLISDWFDTVNAGLKTESGSYEKIASNYPDVLPSQFLFLSDNVAEVDAAIAAGMQSKVIFRPGNAELASDVRERLQVLESFDELEADLNTKKLEALGKRDRSETEEVEREAVDEKEAAAAPSNSDKTKEEAVAAEDSHKDKKLKPLDNDKAEERRPSGTNRTEDELPAAPSAGTGTTISDLLNEVEQSNGN